ncbi:hypothetical protein ASF48_06960 [Rathayibacter sp. Leaf299]|uniref:LamG-like jellyroll fold domain-containing protein n=1 Tax=Rathayibacter sp. Leaf299 TaxID=1736328 RepID=UPI0006FCF617|nr:LamG-like jellyroll fold domain-containing protein [Rathayibacter sp. Leaf299]KQQ22870.1 hypothetical protein ASF48_06960 [Rathayibacter sp. Leaf299]
MAGYTGEFSGLRIRTSGGWTTVGGITPKVVPPAPLAQWNFTESAAPFRSTAGDLPLSQAGPGTATRVTTPFGTGINFSGNSFLRLAKENVGRLNIGLTGNAVTVAAWVNLTDTNAGFVGGCWQEDNDDPRRSYGLFYDLNTYGGDEKSNFHISKDGRPTPGYPFSRDYAASKQSFTRGAWQLHVGTYDGAQAISYLNGVAERYPTYTDGLGNTYSKNPYVFTAGLNSTPCDFTVGAVELTAGPGNYVIGSIARLRVWDRALTPQEVAALYSAEVPS